MRILIAPLNWGLGHATRCIQLVRQYVDEGHQVVLGGDGESLHRLSQAFPSLPTIKLAKLNIWYSEGSNQVGAMLRALPKIIRFSIKDKARLNSLLQTNPFDLVISDNRFGLRSSHAKCVYITHQLWIRLPNGLHWMEPTVAAIHRHIYRQFDEVWVPDYADTEHNLSGILGHPQKIDDNITYIGPLSRFTTPIEPCAKSPYKIVAIVSGLEPHRSIFERELIKRLIQQDQPALLIRGLVHHTFMLQKYGHVDVVPNMDDQRLLEVMMDADKIICRSGYSSIMDLDRLGLLKKTELIPTPGQSEQEYLAEKHKNNTFLGKNTK